jgi:DNA-binding CsgD family transcriptional regulator
MRSWVALRAGELDDAEADARAALEVLALHDVAFVIPGPLAILAFVLRERDQLDEADALLREWGYESGDGDSLFHLFLLESRGRLRVAQQRWDEGRADLLRGMELTQANGCISPGFIAWDSVIVTAEALAGPIDDATRAHAARAVELGNAFGAPRARAEALRVEALAAPEVNLTLVEAAADIFQQLGAKLEEARTICLWTLSRRGAIPSEQAADLLARALELAERAGSARLASLVRREMEPLGARPRRRGATGVDSLTPSERRVAALAAAGHTNKAVAQELFVTVKTVETHLAHAYQKLAISSRADLKDALAG